MQPRAITQIYILLALFIILIRVAELILSQMHDIRDTNVIIELKTNDKNNAQNYMANIIEKLKANNIKGQSKRVMICCESILKYTAENENYPILMNKRGLSTIVR